jgi:peptidoglycan/xylan/chitin deacetylase (PgdA/CDA1 family)
MKLNLDRLVLELASFVPPVRRPGGIRVLCYHRVFEGSEVPPRDGYAIPIKALEAHLAAVVDSGRTVVPIRDLEKCVAGSILLTFDDNLVSHVACALPILRAVGVTATFYLSPADLGAAGRLSHHHVGALLRAGMFVGAHGNRHVPAVRIGPAEFRREVEVCRAFLQGLGMPLTWAYPGGYIKSFRDYHEHILLDQGFTIRFGTLEGVCRPSALRVQPRYVIRRHSSLRYVRAALRGGLQLVSLAKRAGALAGHGALRP